MNTLCLVTCVAEKRRDASPARDLYQSPLFSRARRFAEDRYDSWFILSAKHGLVHPGDVLAPYNQSLLDSTDGERRTWAVRVFEQLSRQTNADARRRSGPRAMTSAGSPSAAGGSDRRRSALPVTGSATSRSRTGGSAPEPSARPATASASRRPPAPTPATRGTKTETGSRRDPG